MTDSRCNFNKVLFKKVNEAQSIPPPSVCAADIAQKYGISWTWPNNGIKFGQIDPVWHNSVKFLGSISKYDESVGGFLLLLFTYSEISKVGKYFAWLQSWMQFLWSLIDHIWYSMNARYLLSFRTHLKRSKV